MNPNPIRCYATTIGVTDTCVDIEGYVHYPEYNEPPSLFTVSILKMSWDEFQPYLDTWKDTQETACTIVSKDEIYITKVVFLYDTDKVHELEKGSADEIEEYAITHSYFGLPVIVYLHLIGHLKTRLSLPPIR